MRKPMTALGLLLRAERWQAALPPPKLEDPEVWKMGNGYEIMLGVRKKGPTKMRKGRSGEIPRRGY